MERKCKIDELVSANVDYFSFSPQSKSWLKSQTPPSIMPRAMQKLLLMAKFDRKIWLLVVKHRTGCALFLRDVCHFALQSEGTFFYLFYKGLTSA